MERELQDELRGQAERADRRQAVIPEYGRVIGDEAEALRELHVNPDGEVATWVEAVTAHNSGLEAT